MPVTASAARTVGPRGSKPVAVPWKTASRRETDHDHTTRAPIAVRSSAISGWSSGSRDATATLLFASSIAGLLYGPHGWWYDPDPATLPAFLGQDLMTLVFGLPLLLGSSFLARRGSLRGVLCWMGAFFYIAYSYYFYVIGGRFNAFFPLYIAIVSMGTYGALALLFSLDVAHACRRISTVRPPP